MIDLLFIMRDALASSLVGGLITALRAREAGREVTVLLTQEALAATARGSFQWPRELAGQEMRLKMADRASAAGVPVLGRGEGRQVDVKGLLTLACTAGVAVYACPIWTDLLALDGELPAGVTALGIDGLLPLLQEAKRVIGTL